MNEIKTAKEIYENMVRHYENACGRSLYGDSDMAVRMYAAAAEIESLYAYNDWIRKQCFPDTAEGEYLDNHAKMRGIGRKNAEKAKGKIRFYIDEAVNKDVLVDAGTQCITAAGTKFITVAEGKISAGDVYCDVDAEAENGGASGNVSAGTVVFMVTAPMGITRCENTEAFTGGADREDDVSLRARVLASYKTLPNGANKAYYEKTVLGVDGVGAVLVLPKNRGLGTVDIMLTSKSGIADEELINKVSDALNATREICVDINVLPAEARTVDIEVNVDAEEDFDFDEVKTAVENAVRNYFDGTALGKGITVAKLGNLVYSTEGVKNYRIINPTEDIDGEAGVLPTVGNISVNGWGQ